MKINGNNHLCYSMNVFPEKDWLSADSEVRKKVLALRRAVTGSDSAKFAIGLWLDADTACEFRKKKNLREFKDWLSENNLYVFTFNAFPYGNFHGRPVKRKVYQPDWTTDERLKYTCTIADILSELLPRGVTGSISTLPGAYKADVRLQEQLAKIAKNLLSAARYLRNIHRRTGKKIVLGIEPEPDCLWESASEFSSFYIEHLSPDEFIGICYDTCHQEVQFGKPGKGLGELKGYKVPIAKFQLSAALKAPDSASKKALAKFADKVYLHQTRVLEKDGTVSRYPDLPAAIAKADKSRPWMVHYHIPIFASELPGGLLTAKDELRAILSSGMSANLEIETYTFSVLPEKMRKLGVISSMRKEYAWVIRGMKGK